MNPNDMYTEWNEWKWRQFVRNSGIPYGTFDHRRPRHLGHWFFAVLLVALVCVACVGRG